MVFARLVCFGRVLVRVIRKDKNGRKSMADLRSYQSISLALFLYLSSTYFFHVRSPMATSSGYKFSQKSRRRINIILYQQKIQFCHGHHMKFPHFLSFFSFPGSPNCYQSLRNLRLSTDSRRTN